MPEEKEIRTDNVFVLISTSSAQNMSLCPSEKKHLNMFICSLLEQMITDQPKVVRKMTLQINI